MIGEEFSLEINNLKNLYNENILRPIDLIKILIKKIENTKQKNVFKP